MIVDFQPRHPGITQLVAGGRPLGGLAPLGTRQVAGLGAAVATTLADLHDLGIVHGAVSADHILIDPDGHPFLWPPAPAGHAGRPGAEGDVATLAEILDTALAAADPSPPLRRVLAGAAHRDPRRRPTARRLAQLLTDRVPGACLPVPGAAPADDPPPGRLPFRLRTRPATVASAVAVAGLVPLALVGRMVLTPSSGQRPPAVVTTGFGRYVIGDAADRVVMGRWRCEGRLAALLRPTTGEVWVFDTWAAPGHPLAARRVAQVAGAESLMVETPAAEPGCDRLVITRPGAPPVLVDPDFPNPAIPRAS